MLQRLPLLARTVAILVAGISLAGCLRPFEPLAGDDAATSAPSDGGVIGSVMPSPPDLAGDGGADRSGRDLFTATVLPILDQRCSACHAAQGGVGPAFMKPDAYDSVLAWPGMITRDPSRSLLLTKGPHNNVGYFTDPEKLVVLAWLSVEASALAPSMTTSVETPPVAVSEGANVLPLDGLGKDFLGAEITFDATRLGQVLKVTNLIVRATGPSGIHLVHPLFIGVRNGVKTPDPVDSLDGYELTLPNGATAPLGPGLVLLTNVLQNDQMSIAFESITRWDGVGNLGGCKAVAAFTQFARPAIMSAGCDSRCHGGTDTIAKNAVDMSMLADTSAAAQAIACGQLLGRVSPAMPSASEIFVVTDPATMSNHKLRFTFPDATTFNMFTTTVSQWIVQEQ